MDQNEEEYIYNVPCKVRVVKENGFLFASPLEKITEEDKKNDIFVHYAHITNPEFDWKNAKSGQSIMVNCLTKTSRGYTAISATFLKAKNK